MNQSVDKPILQNMDNYTSNFKNHNSIKKGKRFNNQKVIVPSWTSVDPTIQNMLKRSPSDLKSSNKSRNDVIPKKASSQYKSSAESSVVNS